MKLELHRTTFGKDRTLGVLLVNGVYICDTLERKKGECIPTGWYRVRMTMSAKFGEILPILDFVPGRSGIRIHAGNTPKDTQGCILVGKRVENHLEQSQRTKNVLVKGLLSCPAREEIYIEVTDHDAVWNPDRTAAGYDNATLYGAC